jgi:hypothetical protein
MLGALHDHWLAGLPNRNELTELIDDGELSPGRREADAGWPATDELCADGTTVVSGRP